MPPLRLLSIDATDVSATTLPTLIADAGADVACVHGAPSLLRWRSKCAALGRRAGLVVVSGGRTGGGVLLLSSLGVDLIATRDLRFAESRGVRPAGASVAVLRRLGCEVVLAGARLTGDVGHRHAQVGEVQAVLDVLAPDTPAIVSVDGLAAAGSRTRDLLEAGRATLAGTVFVDRRIAVTPPPGTHPGLLVVDLELP